MDCIKKRTELSGVLRKETRRCRGQKGKEREGRRHGGIGIKTKGREGGPAS